MKRCIVSLFEPGEIRRFDTLKPQFRTQSRATVIRGLCLLAFDMPETLAVVINPGAPAKAPEVPTPPESATLRERMVAAMRASPAEVFTPAPRPPRRPQEPRQHQETCSWCSPLRGAWRSSARGVPGTQAGRCAVSRAALDRSDPIAVSRGSAPSA